MSIHTRQVGGYPGGVEKKDYVAVPPGKKITREEALAISRGVVEAMESRRLLDEAARPASPPDADSPGIARS